MTERIRRMVPREIDEPRDAREIDPGIGGLAAVAHAIGEEVSTEETAGSYDKEETVLATLPPYVVPQEEVPHSATLTAAVVVRDYEETAKKFLEIAAEIGTLAKTCEDYMAELRTLREELEGHAQSVRDRGKVIFEAIETTAKLTKKVREDANLMIEAVISSPLTSI